jgi:hypothetical protein
MMLRTCFDVTYPTWAAFRPRPDIILLLLIVKNALH